MNFRTAQLAGAAAIIAGLVWLREKGLSPKATSPFCGSLAERLP